VWYCSAANASSLPIWKWSPEGHVVSVNVGADTMIVDNADGTPRHVLVNSGTTFTYQRNTTLGTGTGFLADLQHGFKVSVDVVNPLAAPLVATSVNIERAVDGGYINSASLAQGIQYGQPSLSNLRWYPFSASPNPVFSWWDFEQPAAASTVITGGFLSALQGIGTTRVVGASDLTWDSTNSVWDARTAILMPVPLPEATITTAYSGTGTTAGPMVISYTDPLNPGSPTLTSVTLNPVATASVVQTVVLLVTPDGIVYSSSLDPVANWAADLTASNISHVWVAAVPTAAGLQAYSVVAVVNVP
jgi:hypothetical protein